MKAHKIAALALAAAVVLTCGAAYAELVEGKVVSVNLDGNSLDVEKKDAATGATEKVSISVSDATTYSGEVTALAEVIEGDAVKVEADKDATSGKWTAKSVDVAAAPE